MVKLKSRKLIVTVVTAIAIGLNDKFEIGLSQDTITMIVGLVAAYVLGQGVADVLKNKESGNMDPVQEDPIEVKRDLVE